MKPCIYTLVLVLLSCPRMLSAQTIILKPGPVAGKDAAIMTTYGCTVTIATAPAEVINYGAGQELPYVDWTYNAIGCGHGTGRFLLQFDGLSALPPGVSIANATLKLYGVPSSGNYGNSSFPGSPYQTDNQGWLRRVTSSWAEQTVTWNTQPSVTTTGQVAIPASTARFSWDVALNVTGIISDIVASGSNNGMLLQLQDESIYRGVFFASSDHPDSSLWPELIIDYTISNPSIITGAVTGPLCAGATVSVPYTASGIFNAGNVFTAQLSDASGSFAAPAVIGTLSSTAAGAGIISAVIPATTPPGNAYRIRVISSNLPQTGTPNAGNIVIGAIPAQPGPIAGDTLVCTGSAQQYSVPAVAGASSYAWSLPPGWTGSSSTTSIVTTAGASGGVVAVIAVNACGSSAPRLLHVNATSTALFTPAVTIAANNGFCAGTPVVITATAVNAGASPAYQWTKNGMNVGGSTPVYTDPAPRTGDVFTVTLSASGLCIAPGPVTSNAITAVVMPPVVPGININSNPPHILCEGEPIRFTANINGGGPTPQYQWYRNGVLIPGAVATTYLDAQPVQGDTIQAVLLSSATCATTPVTYSNKMGLKVDPFVRPAVRVTASPGAVVRAGQPITFQATAVNGGGNPAYQWIRNGLWIPGATAGTYTASAPQAGDVIQVQLTSSAPCATPPIVTSEQLLLQAPNSVGTVPGGGGDVRLFPNPNNGRFSLSGKRHGDGNVNAMFTIVNTLGQTVYSRSLHLPSGEWSVAVDAGHLAAGIYILRFVAGDVNRSIRFEAGAQ